MKRIDFGQSVAILANVGVITGIIFLAIELRQNNQMMVSQTRSNIATSLSSTLNPVTTDAELAEAIYRLDTGEGVTGAEEYRISLYDEQLFRYWENAHYQYRRGLYDENEWAGHRADIAASVNNRCRLAHFWADNREYYSELFVAFIDDVLLPSSCQLK